MYVHPDFTCKPEVLSGQYVGFLGSNDFIIASYLRPYIGNNSFVLNGISNLSEVRGSFLTKESMNSWIERMKLALKEWA